MLLLPFGVVPGLVSCEITWEKNEHEEEKERREGREQEGKKDETREEEKEKNRV